MAETMRACPVLSINLLQAKKEQNSREVMSEQRVGGFSLRPHPSKQCVYSPWHVTVSDPMAPQKLSPVQGNEVTFLS